MQECLGNEIEMIMHDTQQLEIHVIVTPREVILPVRPGLAAMSWVLVLVPREAAEARLPPLFHDACTNHVALRPGALQKHPH